MKGQQEALTAILISGILIGVVGSVYFWGLPLIQKNKDIAILENSESFMRNLNEKVKYIANNGGHDQVRITVPGIMKFTDEKFIELVVDTSGTIYSTGAEIPIGKNSDCNLQEGTWGINDMEILCVKSLEVGEGSYKTTYTLKYLKLKSGAKEYIIELSGQTSSGGEEHFIGVENKGTTTDGNLINTLIEISIV